MAGNSVGKRMVNQIWKAARDPSPATALSLRKGVHTSVYDKNVDDQIRSPGAPDGGMEEPHPHSDNDKYWAPNPRTGVFGPATDHAAAAAAGGNRNGEKPNAGSETVLEQQAWFRPLEDVEKPHQP